MSIRLPGNDLFAAYKASFNFKFSTSPMLVSPFLNTSKSLSMYEFRPVPVAIIPNDFHAACIPADRDSILGGTFNEK